jgi:hypothetical protein
MDRLVAYYNAASGAKADEDRKRAEEVLRLIEEGQVMNHNLLDKMDQRHSKVENMKEKKAHDVRELNLVSQEVKYKVYEQDEQKSYDFLAKNVQRDQLTEKTIKKNEKEMKDFMTKKKAENLGKWHQAVNHHKEVQDDLKE